MLKDSFCDFRSVGERHGDFGVCKKQCNAWLLRNGFVYPLHFSTVFDFLFFVLDTNIRSSQIEKIEAAALH